MSDPNHSPLLEAIMALAKVRSLLDAYGKPALAWTVHFALLEIRDEYQSEIRQRQATIAKAEGETK